MSKLLCVWEMEPTSGKIGYKPLKAPHRDCPITTVITALGFEAKTLEHISTDLANEAHPRRDSKIDYDVYRTLDGTVRVLVRYEGRKGDRTHLIILHGRRYLEEAPNWDALDRHHHSHPVRYLADETTQEGKLSPEDLRKRMVRRSRSR